VGGEKCTHKYWSENLTATDLSIEGKIILKCWQSVVNKVIKTSVPRIAGFLEYLCYCQLLIDSVA
jgi:hypothetical protein